MHCIKQNFKLNAQVCINSLSDLNIDYCVDMALFVNLLKKEFSKNLLCFESESKRLN